MRERRSSPAAACLRARTCGAAAHPTTGDRRGQQPRQEPVRPGRGAGRGGGEPAARKCKAGRSSRAGWLAGPDLSRAERVATELDRPPQVLRHDGVVALHVPRERLTPICERLHPPRLRFRGAVGGATAAG
jgi:hypothetical protein